jgi:hypothetical protein
MRHNVNVIHTLTNSGSVTNVALDKINSVLLPVALNVSKAAREKVIDDSDRVATLNQTVDQVAAYETRATRHKNLRLLNHKTIFNQNLKCKKKRSENP